MSARDCTVIVSSCDAYSDLWPPFFTLLKRNWNCLFPIVLNTESKSFSFDGLDIKTLSLFREGESVPWGKRLRETLARVDSEYILFLLEDFYLTSAVDEKRLDEVFQWMEENHDIAVFSFYPAPGDNEKSERYKGFEKRAQRAAYRFNAQAALWRRERIIGFVEPHESAWEWEHTGNERSYSVADAFYSAIEGYPQIFPYDPFVHGLYDGKWLKAVPELFAQNGIEVDFAERGFFDLRAKARHPQVGIGFETDAVLYLDFADGYSESCKITANGVTPGVGEFERVFDGLDKLDFKSTIRLDPTSHGMCAIDCPCVTLVYCDGSSETLTASDLGGNGVQCKGALVFLCDDPQLLFDCDPRRRLLHISISGYALARIPEPMLDQALKSSPHSGKYKVRHLIAKFKEMLC
ncbi:MAG: hypothetical protein RR998_05495 [Oscillospiraceae bacterium]